MTNLEALKAQCKLICNTCYVDMDVLNLTLLIYGIDPEATAVPDAPDLIRAAIVIVKGWAETSRSENGISVAVDMATLKKNIMFWCEKAGLEASEFVDGITTLESGSDLW